MSDSLKLETLSPGDPSAQKAFDGLAASATAADGQPPFNDQARADARAGTNRVVLAWVKGTLVGAAAVTDGVLELVIAPDARRTGLGERLLLQLSPTPTLAWAHGNHPGARALAARHGFDPVRTLLQLRMPLTAPVAESPTPFTIDSFRPGHDDPAWVELNAQVFAGHPEQGRITLDDLYARMNDEWFDAGDFLLARDAEGRLVGYNWLKIEPGDSVGEIYVIGVEAEQAGRGLGRALMQRGLNHLMARGCRVAALYVEEDNGPAVPLYRSLGFTDHTIDVQYRRRE